MHLHGLLGDTALHAAAAGGHCEALKTLLSIRADVDDQDLDGETALHYAVLAGHTSAVQLLIDAGTDTSCENFSMETPLLVAKQNPAYFLGVETEGAMGCLEARKLPLLRSSSRESLERVSSAMIGLPACTRDGLGQLLIDYVGEIDSARILCAAEIQLGWDSHSPVDLEQFFKWLFQ
eukprot:TRINITY_DN15559_c0_g1_i3.p1 TRINITY_DN15559_c0_g1~~TRINITY_DN15559_c0_g1_i3.p1  ORF type:complete len:178 (+),score=36.73 TRINITY_DN15559_c0_g1_i3:322-855(+)